MTIKYGKNIFEAVFIERKNRFSAVVKFQGEFLDAHLPNSGRMGELLIRGTRVLIQYAAKPGRKTDYDLIQVLYQDKWVSIDSRIPNLLFAEAIQEGELRKFSEYRYLRKEVSYGGSRLDILLEDKETTEKYYIELKSVTLVEDGVARFPDAPTSRGTRHLLELEHIVEEGESAGVVFIIQREDAEYFTPNRETDPLFADTLYKVNQSGVEIQAYRCNVTRDSISIGEEIEVIMDCGGV